MDGLKSVWEMHDKTIPSCNAQSVRAGGVCRVLDGVRKNNTQLNVRKPPR